MDESALRHLVGGEADGGGAAGGVETTSPGVLTRSGWSRNSVKPGDHVAVEFNPRSGLNSTATWSPGFKELRVHPERVNTPGLVVSTPHSCAAPPPSGFTTNQITQCGFVH